MTPHEYAEKWYRDALECYEDYSIEEMAHALETLTLTDLEEAREMGYTKITDIDEWRDAISAALEARRAAQGGTL